ncbi:NAD(P)-binding protein [Streptomyces sp. NPDC058701]|uniref:NAD(P)-binding protein n=1 Tax=Streptomyces sp. NPDC058701 TaxID=3346608 RepID=UPI00365DDEF4
MVVEHVGVAVIGGGQSGLAAAHALARRGRVPALLAGPNRPGHRSAGPPPVHPVGSARPR